MDLDEMKSAWKAEQQALEKRLRINEALVQDMVKHKQQNSFMRLLQVSIVGRNLAIVYAAVSIGLSYASMGNWAYSLPPILGALAMIWSFVGHLALKKPNIASMTTVALQKAIAQFKRHTAKYAPYDTGIVLFWGFTTAPAYLKIFMRIAVYDTQGAALSYIGVSLLMALATIVGSRLLYSGIDNRLAEAEAQLAQITAFEQEDAVD